MQLENAVPDPRTRRYIKPVRIVWRSENCPDASALLNHHPGPAQTLCVMAYKGSPPGLLVDFGRELHGGIRIQNGPAPRHAPVRVRVRFGESVSEAMGEPNNDHAIHDQEILVPWFGVTEIGNTGFRFVRIDLLEEGSELHLCDLSAVFLYRDLPYLGAFLCDDERLNTIWKTGAYTVHLCMQEQLWDGIKRDRLVWIGDMHPETMVINSVFGEQDIVPQSLDYVRDQTPLPGWMNGISSYSLWWVCIQHDWYLYHGNREYLEAQRPYLLELLKILRTTQIGPEGQECLGEGRFLDWPSSGQKDALHAGLHALLTLALSRGATLCDWLGETAESEACQSAVTWLKSYRPPVVTSKQANALLALAGIAHPNDINRSVLSVNPTHALSTFYGYYVLEARAAAGDFEGCLDTIREFWGAMLDLGATTFWEDFDLDWVPGSIGIDQVPQPGKTDIHADFGAYCYKGLRHSLCHGWAAGPTAWLSRHVLGFRPLEPGCRRMAVVPHLGKLAFAEGAFPTPRGVVRVQHHREAGGSVKTQVHAPEGIEIVRPGSVE